MEDGTAVVITLTQEQFRRAGAWRRAAVGEDRLTRAACFAAAMKVAGLTGLETGGMSPASRASTGGQQEAFAKVIG